MTKLRFLAFAMAAALATTSFVSCDDDDDDDTAQTSQDNGSSSGSGSINIQTETYGSTLLAKVTAGSKPYEFTKMKFTLNSNGTSVSLTIPEYTYNGTTIPSFKVTDLEYDKSGSGSWLSWTYTKDYSVTDDKGGTHTGKITYKLSTTDPDISITETYSGISDQLTFNCYPNAVFMAAGSYSGNLTTTIDGSDELTELATITIASDGKQAVITLPEESASTSDGTEVTLPECTVNVDMDFDDDVITIDKDTYTAKTSDGQTAAKVTISGTISVDGTATIQYTAVPEGQTAEMVFSFAPVAEE